MGRMPKKKSKTASRVFALALAYLTLCLAGGVVSSLFMLPAIFGANKVAQAMVPSLEVEGVDFDVTDLPQKSTIYASDGKTQIAQFYAQNRVVVPIKDISEPMQRAVVAREDRRFFSHSGVDVQGVMRAFVQTYLVKGSTQGGSSLTQQYVKNVLVMKAMNDDDPIAQYHATEDTLSRKMREMLIAVQMEKQYSKLEILQGYLNIAQFGRGVYGVETAAQRYFNTSAKNLNIVQAATIAAITKNPQQFDPSVEANQPEAERQRNTVLQLMYQEGYITKAEYDENRQIPIKDTLNVQKLTMGCQNAGDYAFFCSYVMNKILNSKEFGATAADRDKLLKEGGLSIVTTLDLDASDLLMKTARSTIPPNDASGMEIVMASVKPGTGEVLGFGLNRTYDAAQGDSNDPTHTAVNYAVDEVDGGGSGFPIGSSWKPINLIAWMQAGRSINENLQTSTAYVTNQFACAKYSGTTEVWNVQNALGTGTVNPESPFLGLLRSHNTTQASMGTILGLCKVADTAKQVGYHNAMEGREDIYDPATLNPPMLIGAVSVSPLTMANVFATYAANGVACTPIAMTKVTKSNGDEIEVPKANCHQAVDSGIIQTLAYTLNQGVVRPDGAGGSAQLDGGRKTFAKTGTNGNTYVTTGGFIPNQIATFVLVGDAQDPAHHPIENIAINGAYHGYWDGSTIAAPAWKNFMNAYAAKKKLPIDNNYGKPDSKYMATSYSSTPIGSKTTPTYSSNSNANGTTNSMTNGTTTQGNAANTNGTNGTTTQGNTTNNNTNGNTN